MGKTTFTSGDTLDAGFLNTIYGSGSNGGHIHSGIDADGNCGKIDLSSNTTGILPSPHQYPFRGAIDGYQLTWANSGDSLSIGTGWCYDDVSHALLALSSIMVKKVLAVGYTAFQGWTPGSGSGGVATGCAIPASNNSKWLHVFAIGLGTSSETYYTADIGLDDSLTASNLRSASGYNRYRRIGSIRVYNNGGTLTIEPFIQVGDRFTWSYPVAHLSSYVPLTGYQQSGGEHIARIKPTSGLVHATYNAGPTGVSCHMTLRVNIMVQPGDYASIICTPPGMPGTLEDAYWQNEDWSGYITSNADFSHWNGTSNAQNTCQQVECDSVGGQIRVSTRSGSASNYYDLQVASWIDSRGKDA